MLRVHMLSGEEVSIPAKDVSNVRAVKLRLHQIHGAPPRFRQRLVQKGASLEDADELDSALELNLVLQSLSSASPTQAEELVDAASHGFVDEVECMLELPLDPNLVNAFGQSPLFCSSVNGHVEVVRLLVEAGADKDFAYNGETALTCASQSGHADVVRLLVEAGANKDWANKEGGGYTALMHSASNGNFEIARFLLEAGVDNDAASEDGCTALTLAANGGRVEVVRLLMEANTNADLSLSGKALMLAAERGHVGVVHLLLEAGAAKDWAKETCLV